jgi:hypothetical protein
MGTPGDIVGLAEGDLPSWYPSQEVLSSSPGHVYFTARNYSHLQKSIQWGSRSTDQWRRSPDWHTVGGMLESDKMSPRPFYIT